MNESLDGVIEVILNQVSPIKLTPAQIKISLEELMVGSYFIRNQDNFFLLLKQSNSIKEAIILDYFSEFLPSNDIQRLEYKIEVIAVDICNNILHKTFRYEPTKSREIGVIRRKAHLHMISSKYLSYFTQNAVKGLTQNSLNIQDLKSLMMIDFFFGRVTESAALSIIKSCKSPSAISEDFLLLYGSERLYNKLGNIGDQADRFERESRKITGYDMIQVQELKLALEVVNAINRYIQEYELYRQNKFFTGSGKYPDISSNIERMQSIKDILQKYYSSRYETITKTIREIDSNLQKSETSQIWNYKKIMADVVRQLEILKGIGQQQLPIILPNAYG